jgi:hypothetical protein
MLESGKYSIMGDVVTFKSLVGNNLTLEGRLQSVVMSDNPCHWDINFERASHAHVSSRGWSERGDHIRQAIDVAFQGGNLKSFAKTGARGQKSVKGNDEITKEFSAIDLDSVRLAGSNLGGYVQTYAHESRESN